MPDSIEVNIENVIKDMDRFIVRQVVGLVFEIHAELVEATPIDLGWARANYVPQIATPYREDLTDEEPTEGGARSRSAANLSELGSIAASYRVSQGALFISNNVPYIQVLNDGHSTQAPPGFIPMAVERAVQTRIRLS